MIILPICGPPLTVPVEVCPMVGLTDDQATFGSIQMRLYRHLHLYRETTSLSYAHGMWTKVHQWSNLCERVSKTIVAVVVGALASGPRLKQCG